MRTFLFLHEWCKKKKNAHMCTFKLSTAKRLPYGISEYTCSSARHARRTAGSSDVSSSTIDCLLTGHSIKIFRFSAEGESKQTGAQRTSLKDAASLFPRTLNNSLCEMYSDVIKCQQGTKSSISIWPCSSCSDFFK